VTILERLIEALADFLKNGTPPYHVEVFAWRLQVSLTEESRLVRHVIVIFGDAGFGSEFTVYDSRNVENCKKFSYTTPVHLVLKFIVEVLES
jgi:hypothetical protein